MSTVDSLLDQALELSPEERADLARRLILSLDAQNGALSDDEWIAAWKPELERRLRAYESGEAKAIDWRKSVEQVRASLAERSRG